MENSKLLHAVLISFSLAFVIPCGYGWGFEGHIAVCRIAQARLSKAAAAVVTKLLPASAKNDLGVLCPWPDQVKLRYRWSSSLHFINTPHRDCKDSNGVKGNCLAGAINNYTTELLTYPNKRQQYNLTEALLFLSHFMGDIHQPLHVGYTSDKGGNTIKVKWFNRATNLHHVWDTNIINKGKGVGGNNSNIDAFIIKIQQKINSQWAKQVNGWGSCNTASCPNIYALESIKAACQWAYKGVQSGSILKDDYFQTRLPVVELRLAQAGVRLAAALNRIFK
ncbi:endonuclease 2 [Perilla frutescens var. hirtella]|nr:endonuclease 2 [Perilla frutescens var. hirtella]